MMASTQAPLAVLAGVNAFGGMIFGYNIGVIAGAVSTTSQARVPFELTPINKGFLSTSVLVGAFLASMVAGIVADRIGRKMTLMVASVIAIIFSIGSGLSQHLWELLLMRALLGLSIGTAGVVCPMYVGEMASDANRGTLGTVFQLSLTISIFFAYCISAGLAHMHNSWRWIFIIGVVPGALLLVVTLIMPESTVYSSKSLRLNSEDAPLIKTTRDLPFGQRMSMFLHSRALWIGLTIAAAQQLTGINAFMYFAPEIFSSAGVKNTGLATIGLGFWNFVTTFIATFLIDRLGRRPLLILGTTFMTISCLLLGVVYQFMHQSTGKSALSIMLLLLFIAAFEASCGPLFWIVASELFTPEVKSIGASTMNAVQWGFNILLAMTFSALVDRIGDGPVFFIFGGFGLVSVLIMFLYLPETRPTKEIRG